MGCDGRQFLVMDKEIENDERKELADGGLGEMSRLVRR